MTSRVRVRAMVPGGRLTINRDATLRVNGATEKFALEHRGALRRLVAKHCGFDCPEIEAMRVPTAPDWT